MDKYITGAAIKELRERRKLTQLQLADILGVSDKTVSKWETGKGYPDITLLEPIAEAFGVSVPELMSGNTVSNTNISANMIRSKFYICPVCGNVIHSMGEAAIYCHGISLLPEIAEQYFLQPYHKAVRALVEEKNAADIAAREIEEITFRYEPLEKTETGKLKRRKWTI